MTGVRCKSNAATLARLVIRNTRLETQSHRVSKEAARSTPLVARRRWRQAAVTAQSLLRRLGLPGLAMRLGCRVLVYTPDDVNLWNALAQSAEALKHSEAAACLYGQRLPPTLPDPRAEAVFVPVRQREYLLCVNHRETVQEHDSITVSVDVHYPIAQAGEALSKGAKAPALEPYTRRDALYPCQPVLHTIEKARIWHDREHTLITLQNGATLAACTEGCATVAQAASQVHTESCIDGDVILLGGRGGRNYYHWLLDHLPKLGVLDMAGHSISPSARVLLEGAPTAFQIDSLARLGIDSSRIINSAKTGRRLRIEKLIAPRLDNKLGLHMGRWQQSWLRATCGLPALEDAPLRERGRRLFIARDGKRQLADSPAINQVLQHYDMETVYPERLTIAEQAALFDSAELIVGPHGAGLANAIFARPGTGLIEAYERYLPPCFWALAVVCDLEYDNVSRHAEKTPAYGVPSDSVDEARELANRSAEAIGIDSDALASAIAATLFRIDARRTTSLSRAA